MENSSLRNARHSIREELSGVVLFVATIWVAFVLDKWFLPLSEWFALIPRHLARLPGIVMMPFLHASWGHLLSNTTPLLVLLVLLAGSRARSWLVVAWIIVVGGGMLWLFGRNGTNTSVTAHVGASGLVFGLITFLLASGYFERRFIPLLVAVLVAFLYGGTLLLGVLPLQRGVSWDGHLWGAVAGVAVAYLMAARTDRVEPARPRVP